MTNLYIVGGTMGVGKTTVCLALKKRLSNSVFLDGDWCWDAFPFQITEETKVMVVDNITHTLNNFIHCTAYNNVIFCWVMHEQSIIDSIMSKLDCKNCNVRTISLICDRKSLTERLQVDIDNNIRMPDIIQHSTARIEMYQKLNTIKINTSGKTVSEIVDSIEKL